LKIPKSKKNPHAEEEELQSYESRMSSDWLDDLKPLGTDWRKPFRNRSLPHHRFQTHI
jgi:hypothetical protein